MSQSAATKKVWVAKKSDATMVLSVAGSAVAVGEDTSASTQTSASMTDIGPVTIALGDMTISAAAEGDFAYAAVDADLYASGADILRVHTTEGCGSGDGWSAETCTMEFFAIDVPVDLNIRIDTLREYTIKTAPELLDGSRATATVSGTAYGENTLAEAALSVFAATITSESGPISSTDTSLILAASTEFWG